MNNMIIITIKCDEDYPLVSTVATVKGQIRNYFGSKHIEECTEDVPAMMVTCSISEEDMSNLEEIVDDYVKLIAILTDRMDANGKISENIIDLR